MSQQLRDILFLELGFFWGWAYCSMFYFLSSLVLLENIFTVIMEFSSSWLIWLGLIELDWCLLFSPIVLRMWLFVCLLVSERAQLFSVLKECQGWGWRSSWRQSAVFVKTLPLCPLPSFWDLVKCPKPVYHCTWLGSISSLPEGALPLGCFLPVHSIVWSTSSLT